MMKIQKLFKIFAENIYILLKKTKKKKKLKMLKKKKKPKVLQNEDIILDTKDLRINKKMKVLIYHLKRKIT